MATHSSVTSKRKGLSIRELEAIIANWSDDEDTEPQKELSNELAIDVVLPPETAGELTDAEHVPDDNILIDGDGPTETNGDLESDPEIWVP